MGETINFNWHTVTNKLSERMIDNSLTHLLDHVQKRILKKTIVLNRKLKKIHRLKSYEHFVKVKTKINKKFSNETNENESSKTEVSSDKTNLNDIKDEEENIEKFEQSSHHENDDDTLPKEESNKLIPVASEVPQLEDDDEDTELEIDNNSIEDSISSCNDDSIEEHYSDIMSDDEINKLMIDKNLTEDSINSHDNDESMDNHSNVISNDESMDNHSNVISNDEEQESKTHNNLAKDLKDSPKHNNITENDKEAHFQKNKSTLKIVMTEIIKPKYTLIKKQPIVMLHRLEEFIHNRKLLDKLAADDASIALISSQRNNSSIQESNNNNTNDEDLIHSSKNENAINTRKRVKKNKQTKTKKKDIIISNDNQNSLSHFNEISNDINNSNSNVEALNSSVIDSEEPVGDVDMETDSINLSKKTGKRSKSPLSNERASLAHTLEHMAFIKQRQERLGEELKLFNGNYIHVENESRGGALSEQENSLSQPNVLTGRPMTLDELVQENSLVPLDDSTSAFTLDDLSEDEDLFLMEMPKSMVNQELLGQKMVVRNFDMIIGNTNYKLHRLKNDTLTCVLKENNEKMAFKAVNIQPKGTFMVKQILAPSTEDIHFHQTLNIYNNQCPFPKNLKIRNPIENKNKRLKKYKKKVREDKKKKKQKKI